MGRDQMDNLRTHLIAKSLVIWARTSTGVPCAGRSRSFRRYELCGSASLPVALLIARVSSNSLAVCREDRVGPWGRAYEFWPRSGSAVSGQV